ncbi:MAG: hypothetical protein H0T71_03880 [Acidobacteria bacterium]|nr:hypothetical protein [Acidobacteriota bacterium]
MTASTGILMCSIAVSASIVGALELKSRHHVVTAGFWFEDGMTFELHDPTRIGGPLTADEERRIAAISRLEVEQAFAEFRIHVNDRKDALYRVAVSQMIRPSRGSSVRFSGASGQSMVFGPLGGSGLVNFHLLAAQAMAFAPPGATRADVVDAMGRGVGRAAVHEFAHQILPHGPMHNTQDDASYEFGASNRVAQYYGLMRWSVAYPALVERLARRP